MIPSPEQLTDIVSKTEGDLSEVSFPVLLHAFAQDHRSAVIEVERKPMKKEVVLSNGTPVDCRSNLLHETFGRFLVLRGDLSDGDCQRILQESAAGGVQFGEIMIAEGLLTPSDLYRLLQENLAKKLLDIFSWRTGRYRILTHPIKVESPLKVKVPQLVVTGIVKFASEEEVNEAIGPVVGKTLHLHPDPPYPLQEIRLSASQRQLAGLLTRGKRIDELAAETTVPFEEIIRLVYSLALLGVVVPSDWLPTPVQRSVPAVPDAPPDTKEVLVGEAEPAEEEAALSEEARREELLEAYLRFRKQDAFELLGLEEDASLVQIEQQYLEMSRKLAPWSFTGSNVEKAEELFLAVSRAFGELSDAEQRTALLVRRQNLRQEREKKPAPDRFTIKSDLLDSERQFKRGKEMMDQGRFGEAMEHIQFAHDCDPQNAIYRSELAYCRYLKSPATEADRALRELKETMRVDPACGLTFYYAGVIHGDLGNRQEAESLLRKSIRMMMPDRRPIEALKSLVG